MMVDGRQATILNQLGKYAKVQAFSNECSKLKKVPIDDAAIAYDCPYTMKAYLFIVKKTLHVPSMQNNLISPFIIQETCLVIDGVPRIHCAGGVTRESHYSFKVE